MRFDVLSLLQLEYPANIQAFAAQSGNNHHISRHHDKINKTEHDCIYRREDGEKQKDHDTVSNAIDLRNELRILGTMPGACQLLCAPYHTPSQQPHPYTPHRPQRVDCTRPFVKTPVHNPGNESPLRDERSRRGD